MREWVLWGYHVDDYRNMFDLTDADFNARLLEYGCGLSAVNAELHESTAPMISCDPLFALDKATLSTTVSLVFEDRLNGVRKAADTTDMALKNTLEALVKRRRQGIAQFLDDYECGRAEGRYRAVNEYDLPFENFSFDYALSAHYLFSGLDDQDLDFHLKVIRTLARVAKEVRIFPLTDRHGAPSSMLGPVLLGLQADNYGTEVCEVKYPDASSGNAMLRVWAQQCDVA